MAGESGGVGIGTVGVVGLGTMGAGIVEVFARSGVPVVAVEVDEAALARGRDNLTSSTDRAVSRGKLTAAQRDELLARVTFAAGLAALTNVDLVVEAVPERLDLKRRIFAELDVLCQPGTILASNTSSLPVTEIAVTTSRPGRVLGMHFFNPAPVMKLVEVVRTVVTEDEVVAAVEALCARLGKVDVTIGDRAGFIANWLLFGYLNRAIAMYESRFVTREHLDVAMKVGAGLPMGPLALLDLIGLDTAYEILETMYRAGGRDHRHAPAPMLRQMVIAGRLGRKTGHGFYRYEAGSAVTNIDPIGSGGNPPLPDGVQDRPIHTIGVVGSGPLATGLVAAITAGGYEALAADPGESESSIHWSAALDRLSEVDMIIEASMLGEPATKALLAALDKVCGPGALFATTNAMSIVDAAMTTSRPANVVGLHFADPDARLVEVVRTACTSPQAEYDAIYVCQRLGKASVVCDDRAGFVVNALLVPYLNDAVRMYEQGYASIDDIDSAMRFGCGYPVGPFDQLDTIGLDATLAVQRAIYRETREPGLAPARLLEQMVTLGHLGRKTGRGFRQYA